MALYNIGGGMTTVPTAVHLKLVGSGTLEIVGVSYDYRMRPVGATPGKSVLSGRVTHEGRPRSPETFIGGLRLDDPGGTVVNRAKRLFDRADAWQEGS